ncbi:MAG: gliding motility-associated C-terminal domain-containing protein [Flavobacteriales bacterium]|nr:gliding motility-associated C-terminal domain-containing protein [Flavobacteriales bacterium]
MEAKDKVSELLRERLQGLETPVDPGVWEGIAQQLPLAPATDGFEELLRERFQGHESAVDPSAWQAISSQLGHVAAAASGASGISTTWIAAGVGAVAIIAGAAWMNMDRETSPNEDPIANTQVPPATIEFEAAPSEQTAAPGLPEEPSAAGQQEAASLTAQASVASAGTAKKTEGPKASTQEVDLPPVQSTEAPVPVTTDVEMTGPVEDATGKQVVEQVLQQLEEEAAQAARTDHAQAEEVIRRAERSKPDQREEVPIVDPTPLEEPVKEEVAEVVLFIPNVFTPNADGFNDTFEVQGSGYERVTVRIFSAADSRMVFQANDLTPWDGRDLNGLPSADGQYFYAIEAIDAAGHVHTKGVTIQLMR